jgi:hypothetical protein
MASEAAEVERWSTCLRKQFKKHSEEAVSVLPDLESMKGRRRKRRRRRRRTLHARRRRQQGVQSCVNLAVWSAAWQLTFTRLASSYGN